MKDNIVYSYTDGMAQADGVLMDIGKLGIKLDAVPVDRITGTLQHHMAAETVDELHAMIREAVANAIDKEGDRYMYTALWQGQDVWFVQNERGNYTIMLPEDY